MAVLLVDDKTKLTESIARNLENERWPVLTAASGEEALEILNKRPDVDILATDFHMPPGMDGADLINHALAQRPDLYTIVFTGLREREHAVRSLRVGADDFIDKGSDIDDELRRSIHIGHQQLALARMGRELLLKNDEQEILDEVFDTLGDLNRFGGVCLATKELGSRDCRVECAVDLNTRQSVGDPIALGAESAYRFVIDKQTSYFPPILAGEESLKPYLVETKSVIVVPLIFRSHERGALGIEHSEEDRFKIEDLKFLRQAAHWISISMEKLTSLDRVRLEGSRYRQKQGLLARALLHELKNPLNNLSTAVDAALETVESDELDDLYSNLQRINDVADRFLKPLIQGDKKAEMLDVTRVLGEAIVRFRAFSSRDSAAIRYEAEPPIPRLKGNDEMLIAAFVNLLENATKAAGPNGQIDVEASYVSSRNRIEITISDDGPGIAAEALSKIFDYGYTTGDEKSTGYGLGLTRDIVQVHGGDITVDSTENVGSTFKLGFPPS